jgi:hypothetical protein
METTEQLVWLKEPDVPFEEGDANPECFLDFCGCKSCGCDVEVICSPVLPR